MGEKIGRPSSSGCPPAIASKSFQRPAGRYTYVASPGATGAPPSNHFVRGMPTRMAATRIMVAQLAIQTGQTIQAPVSVTRCNTISSRTRRGPGVATTICFLSPGVEKTDGRPIRMSRAGKISQMDNWAAAHGPATHAIISARRRSPDVSGV